MERMQWAASTDCFLSVVAFALVPRLTASLTVLKGPEVAHAVGSSCGCRRCGRKPPTLLLRPKVRHFTPAVVVKLVGRVRSLTLPWRAA